MRALTARSHNPHSLVVEGDQMHLQRRWQVPEEGLEPWLTARARVRPRIPRPRPKRAQTTNAHTLQRVPYPPRRDADTQRGASGPHTAPANRRPPHVPKLPLSVASAGPRASRQRNRRRRRKSKESSRMAHAKSRSRSRRRRRGSEDELLMLMMALLERQEREDQKRRRAIAERRIAERRASLRQAMRADQSNPSSPRSDLSARDDADPPLIVPAVTMPDPKDPCSQPPQAPRVAPLPPLEAKPSHEVSPREKKHGRKRKKKKKKKHRRHHSHHHRQTHANAPGNANDMDRTSSAAGDAASSGSFGDRQRLPLLGAGRSTQSLGSSDRSMSFVTAREMLEFAQADQRPTHESTEEMMLAVRKMYTLRRKEKRREAQQAEVAAKARRDRARQFMAGKVAARREAVEAMKREEEARKQALAAERLEQMREVERRRQIKVSKAQVLHELHAKFWRQRKTQEAEAKAHAAERAWDDVIERKRKSSLAAQRVLGRRAVLSELSQQATGRRIRHVTEGRTCEDDDYMYVFVESVSDGSASSSATGHASGSEDAKAIHALLHDAILCPSRDSFLQALESIQSRVQAHGRWRHVFRSLQDEDGPASASIRERIRDWEW